MVPINFISRRFHSPSNLPRSVRSMRVVSAFGIAISVAALVIATSVGKGFEKEYLKALLDFNSHLILMSGVEIEGGSKVLKEIEGLGDLGITGITPFIYREALAIGGGNIRGVVIKGVDPSTLASVNHMKVSIEDGSDLNRSLKSEGGTINVVAGASLIDLFNKENTIRLMIPEEKGEKFVEVKIVGTFESGIHDYDSQFILMSLDDVRKIYHMEQETISGFEMRLDDPFRAMEVAETLERALGLNYQTMTWNELNEELMAAVKLEKIVSAVIMGIMVIVSMLNIVAVLVLTMMHRMSEVSVLKAIGLANRGVISLFVRGGMRVTLIGTSIGLVSGLIVAWAIGYLHMVPLEDEIYLIKSLPIDISAPICGMIATFCAGVGYLASSLAAGRLARISVSEGLNKVR